MRKLIDNMSILIYNYTYDKGGAECELEAN